MSNTFSCHHPLYSKQTLHINKHGFTIVELLIVIVVIAILAAISIVSYNGIQQRANNTAIINAASQSLKLVQGYIAANGTYPLVSNNGATSSCLTTNTVCHQENVNANVVDNTMIANIATIGILPNEVPTVDSDKSGIMYWYTPSRTMDGSSQPAILVYFLTGKNQQCGLPGVARENGGSDVLVTSTTGYTRNSGTQATLCRVTVSGPAHVAIV